MSDAFVFVYCRSFSVFEFDADIDEDHDGGEYDEGNAREDYVHDTLDDASPWTDRYAAKFYDGDSCEK